MTALGGLSANAQFGGADIDSGFLGQWAYTYTERASKLRNDWDRSQGLRVLGRTGSVEPGFLGGALCTTERMFWFDPDDVRVGGRDLHVRVVGGLSASFMTTNPATINISLRPVTGISTAPIAKPSGGTVPAPVISAVGSAVVTAAATPPSYDVISFASPEVRIAAAGSPATVAASHHCLAITLDPNGGEWFPALGGDATNPGPSISAALQVRFA